MLISLLRKERLFAIPKTFDLFYCLLFLFFFTLHADQLSLSVAGFTLRLNNLLAALLFLSLFLRLRLSLFSIDRKLLYALCFLTFSFLISALLSPYRSRSLLFFGWYIFTMLFYVLLPYLLMTHLDERRVLRLYFLSFFLSGLYGVAQLAISFFGIHDPFAGQIFSTLSLTRPNGFAYEPSYFALYLTPFMVMANLHYFLNPKGDFFLFPTLTTPKILLINFLYLATTSTGASFAYFIFLLVVLFSPFHNHFPSLRRFVKRFSLAIGGGVAALFLLLPSLAQGIFFKFFYLGWFTHHSFFQRWCGIVNGWKLFLEHPFLGVGPGGMPTFFFEKWKVNDPDYLFPGKSAIPLDMNPLKVLEPTNVCTEILGSLGIVGCAAFLFLFWKYYEKTKEVFIGSSVSDEKKHWVLLFFLSTIVMMVVLQFNQGLFRTYIWTHLALGFAITVKRDALHTRELSPQDPFEGKSVSIRE